MAHLEGLTKQASGRCTPIPEREEVLEEVLRHRTLALRGYSRVVGPKLATTREPAGLKVPIKKKKGGSHIPPPKRLI